MLAVGVRRASAAADGLARYDWATPPDADALIVELGANDMLRSLPPPAMKAALAAILDKAKAAHLPILIAGTPRPISGPTTTERLPDFLMSGSYPTSPKRLRGWKSAPGAAIPPSTAFRRPCRTFRLFTPRRA
jgi:lysophospholipase L1-like esterase